MSETEYKNLGIFQQLLIVYGEQIGRLLPGSGPLHVLAVLVGCQGCPTTQGKLIARTGFSQSVVSNLLKRLSEKKIVELTAPRKRYDQALVLTAKGRNLLAEFEDTVGQVLSGKLKKPDQVEDLSKASGIYRAMFEKYPERIKAFKARQERTRTKS